MKSLLILALLGILTVKIGLPLAFALAMVLRSKE